MTVAREKPPCRDCGHSEMKHYKGGRCIVRTCDCQKFKS
jgi:hypothetical protein